LLVAAGIFSLDELRVLIKTRLPDRSGLNGICGAKLIRQRGVPRQTLGRPGKWLGFAFTIWVAFQAKTAAEQARDAAPEVRKSISALDTVGDLSTAITIHLVRSEHGVGVTETQQYSIRTAIDQLSIVVEEIEKAQTHQQQDQLETVRFNRIISNQIERARIDVKKAEA
jgi:hypothetical protein